MYNGILLSHKRNETVSFVEMWMDLDSVIGGKVNQKEKQVSHNGHFYTEFCRVQAMLFLYSACTNGVYHGDHFLSSSPLPRRVGVPGSSVDFFSMLMGSSRVAACLGSELDSHCLAHSSEWGWDSRAPLKSRRFSGSSAMAGASSPTPHFRSVSLLFGDSQEKALSRPPLYPLQAVMGVWGRTVVPAVFQTSLKVWK